MEMPNDICGSPGWPTYQGEVNMVKWTNNRGLLWNGNCLKF